MIRFIHITDTHIGSTPDFSLYGRRPLPWLTKLVDTINALPFAADFILHTGDVTDDGSENAYLLAKNQLQRLRLPVRYVVGNHDDGRLLQRVLLNVSEPPERLTYDFTLAGVHFVVLDSNGSVTPGGEIGVEQRAWLAGHCLPEGPPLVVILHHHPVSLDNPWLDRRGDDWPATMRMDMPDRARVIDTMLPARERLKGVFFGHVHHAFSVRHQGISFTAAASGFCQLRSWPSDRVVAPSGAPPGYNVVTIDDDGQTTIRHLTLPMM